MAVAGQPWFDEFDVGKPEDEKMARTVLRCRLRRELVGETGFEPAAPTPHFSECDLDTKRRQKHSNDP